MYLNRCPATKMSELGPVYPVLFIHGLFSEGSKWKKARNHLAVWFNFQYGGNYFCDTNLSDKNEKLKPADFYTITFSQNYNLSYSQQAQELKQAIDHIKKLNSTKKVILVGHSMGGLAARAYMQQISYKDVYLLVTIGTPHYGSPLAYLKENSEKKAESSFNWIKKQLMKQVRSQENNENNERSWLKKVKDFILQKTLESEKELDTFLASEAFINLAPASEALDQLNSASLPTSVKYVFLIGNLSYIDSLHLPSAGRFYKKILNYWYRLNRKMIRRISKKILAEPFQRFSDYVARYLEEKPASLETLLYDSDGVVPVLSQSLHHFKKPPRLKKEVYLASNHMSQMSSTMKIYQALAVGEAFIDKEN